MSTLLVPCAGRSTRFPNMRPKWLLTHPDGRLMVEKAIEGCVLDRFTHIALVVAKPHDKQFEATLILRQAFNFLGSRLSIIVLPEFTSGQAETVKQAIEAQNITGPVLIKDSDNFISWDHAGDQSNYVVVGDLTRFPDTTNVTAKSYVSVDKNGIVQDIVEKRIISNTFCAGAYQVESATAFVDAYTEMTENSGLERETYVSHVIGWMMARHNAVFRAYGADQYEDWGTLQEWRAKQKRFSTLFCDFDGVLVKNVGQYGSARWDNSMEPLEENMHALRRVHDRGAEIVIVTARKAIYHSQIMELLRTYGIEAHAIITGCRHSHRVMINDFAATNPFPSCSAVSMPRNGDLKAYLNEIIN